MKNHVAGFREAGSFTAGFLIGVAIMIPMFAMTLTNPGDWQLVWVPCALVVLILGLKLRTINAIEPRDRHTIAPELGVFPVRFTELKLEQ